MRPRHRKRPVRYLPSGQQEYRKKEQYIGCRPERAADSVREQPSSSAGRTYCVMAMPPAGQAIPSFPDRTGTAAIPVSARRPLDKRPPISGREQFRKGLRVVSGLLLTVLIMTTPAWLTSERLLPIMKELSASSAAMQLPEGEVTGGIIEGEVITPQPSQTTTTPAASTAPTTTTTTTAAPETDGLLPVQEKQLGGSGEKVGDIYVKNSTGYTPDFASLLKKKADCKIKLNAGYQVLIVHTHTTECYAQRTDGLYNPDYSPRTTDLSQSVAAVGDVLAQQLEAVGIRTLHIDEVHDYPQYNGSYDRALETIKKHLKENPSIEMVLDVHRDAVTYSDGTKLKPTADIDGRKAAQVMIISGCDAGGKLKFPNWERNLTMALQIQQSVQSHFPGLMRPLNFAPYRYNMHMTPNSLLLEFGTDVNTLDEALYSAELTGKAIADVLLKYVVD